MATRKIRPSRKTRTLLPFAPDSQAARARRPTEVLQPLQPLPPEPAADSAPPSAGGEAITIEGERAFADGPAERTRRRHQSMDNLQVEAKANRQTRNLAGRGWT
jgi:hypothetical protein